MKNAADSMWPRIVFGLAVLVFLAAVGWAVNSAVTAYESYRARNRQARSATAPPTASQPPSESVPPSASSSRPSAMEPLEAERARIGNEIQEFRARLEKELQQSRERLEREAAREPAVESSEGASTAPVRTGGAVTPPVRIAGADPDYTAEALAQQVQGVVVLEAIIESDGRVSSTRVLKGLPGGLDDAARDAVARWKFEPAMLDGEPVRSIYTLTINFRLPDADR